MADRFSELVAKGLPDWLKPPLRWAYHPLYRFKVRVWCGLSGLLDRIDPNPAGPMAIPPPMMRFKVGGTPSRDVFLETGRRSVENLLEVLRRAGTPLDDPEIASVLDFGCGCGRTLIWLTSRYPDKRFAGCDVDRRMIAWCRANLPAVEFGVNRPDPPLDRRDGSFDLVFAISVFTHLDETRQLQWLGEFRRLLKPGGRLVLTVHGETVWSAQPSAVREEVGRRGTLTTHSRKLKGLLPDWYQTTFHTREYVEQTGARFFHQVTYWPEGFGFHDAAVLVGPRSLPECSPAESQSRGGLKE